MSGGIRVESFFECHQFKLTKADNSKYGSIVRIRPFHEKPGFQTLDPYS